MEVNLAEPDAGLIGFAGDQANARSSRLSMLRPLGSRNFRLLWVGQTVSILGDQFYFVALAWLTLVLTGSGLALGTVLMAAAIPRGVLMIVGGAVTDRVSPRLIMLISSAARGIVVTILSVLVVTQMIQLWHLILIAIAFGTMDSFIFPAETAIIPSLLVDEQLQAGNGLIQLSMQIAGLAGPLGAGVLVAAAGKTSGSAVAFTLDAASFGIAALCLLAMSVGNSGSSMPATSEPGESISRSIGAGLRYVWNDEILRPLIVVSGSLNFCLNGPIDVGTAALAHNRFPQGAAGFGTILAGFAVGGLVGVIVAGSWPRPRRRGLLVVALALLSAACMFGLGFAPNLTVATVAVGFLGLGAGFINVLMLSWLQSRIDMSMMGRVMSLVMLAGMGLTPVSLALAGALADVNLSLMFSLSAAILLLTGVVTATNGSILAVDGTGKRPRASAIISTDVASPSQIRTIHAV